MTAPINTTSARRIVEAFSVTHAALFSYGTSVTEVDMYGVKSANLTPDTGSADNTGDDGVLSTWTWFNFANLAIEQGYLSFDQYELMSGAPVTTTTVTETTASLVINPLTGFDYSGTPADFTIDGAAITLDQAYASAAAIATAIDADLGAGYTVAPTADDRIAIARTTGVDEHLPIVIGGTDANNIDYLSDEGDAGGLEISVPFWREDCGNQSPLPTLVRMASRDALGRRLALDIVLYKVQYGPTNITNQQYKQLVGFNNTGRVLLSAFDELGNPLPGNKKACGRLVSRTIL